MAAMAFPSTSLMASTPRLLTKPSSLASSSSLFLVSGGGRAARAPLLRRQHGGGALGCRCLFGLGVPELVVIAGVAALVFGPKKLPEIGRSFGKTIKSFQQVLLNTFFVPFSSLLFRLPHPCSCLSDVSVVPVSLSMQESRAYSILLLMLNFCDLSY
ncbi:unnamed protein product [Musa banksii]